MELQQYDIVKAYGNNYIVVTMLGINSLILEYMEEGKGLKRDHFQEIPKDYISTGTDTYGGCQVLSVEFVERPNSKKFPSAKVQEDSKVQEEYLFPPISELK